MDRQPIDRLAVALEDASSSCPSCGHEAIETTQIDHRFPYGEGDQAVELSAMVPLRRCRDCGLEFLDSVAEDRQHEAVCRHLGVMTPVEIREIRQKAGSLSRGEFAKISRLGEATLGRWERGELIQNAANDQLLYLLTFPENLSRLRQRPQRKQLPGALAPGAAADLSSSAMSRKTR
jgi:putative zinc finger/helix-turn-helix YgiT family protein